MAKAIYKFNGEKITKEMFYEHYVEMLENNEQFEQEFDELLDDTNGSIEIFGVSFSASQIIKELDYSTYSMALTEQAEFIARDEIYEIEHSENDFKFSSGGDTVEVVFKEDEDEEDEEE